MRVICCALVALSCLSLGGVKVVSASWGSLGKRIDVRELLLKKIDSGEKEVAIDWQTLGNRHMGYAMEFEGIFKDAAGKSHKILANCGKLPLDPEKWSTAEYAFNDLQNQIVSAYERGEKRFVVAPGTYYLTRSPLQSSHLRFWNLKDFTIDATGCVFVMTDIHAVGLELVHCTNVTFKGATITREVPMFSQGTVKEVGDKHVVIRIHAGYPKDMLEKNAYDRTPVLSFFNRSRLIKHGMEGEANVQKIEKLGEGLYKVHCASPGLKQLQVGEYAAWRRTVPHGGGECRINACTNCLVEDVTVMNGRGGVLHESYGNGNTFRRYTVTFPPPPKGGTEPALLSSGADAFYSEMARKGPTLEGCIFDGMHDDGVNIHGKIWRVKNVVGDKVTFDYCVMLPELGDEIHFFGDKHQLLGKRKVLEIDSREHVAWARLTLRVEGGVPEGSRTVVVASMSGNGFAIRNCITRRHRGRGFLLRGANGIVENCHFENINKMGILVMPEFLWANEGPYAENLIIRNNRFIDCAADYYGTGAVLAVSSMEPMNFENPGGGPHEFVPYSSCHRNIVLEGNTFEKCNGSLISVTSASDVVIRDNTLVTPLWRDYEYVVRKGAAPHDTAVFVSWCKNVICEGNQIVSPGRKFKRIAHCEETEDDIEKGFEVKR